jgi:hypothetical protein
MFDHESYTGRRRAYIQRPTRGPVSKCHFAQFAAIGLTLGIISRHFARLEPDHVQRSMGSAR